MMLRTILAAGALGIAGLSAPALADPAAAPQKVTPAAQSGAAIDPRNDQRRVCVVSDVTGSRLSQKTCKSRAAWIASEGVDPLAKQ